MNVLFTDGAVTSTQVGFCGAVMYTNSHVARLLYDDVDTRALILAHRYAGGGG